MNEIVEDILQKNLKRRKLQSDLFRLCCSEVDIDDPEDFIIMEAEASYEGIAGIVAGKIKETYYRPAVIVTPTGEGEVKGTGRSIEGVNLYELLKTQEDLFEKFGGHQRSMRIFHEERKSSGSQGRPRKTDEGAEGERSSDIQKKIRHRSGSLSGRSDRRSGRSAGNVGAFRQ